LALALLTCTISVAACGFTFEVPQTVVVHLSRGNTAVSGATLRYYSEPECSGPFVEAVTDSSGTANFSRITQRGRYAVVLEKPSLCLKPRDAWSQVWTTTHDPPNELRLDCDLSASTPKVCTRVGQRGV
jgi:hypothetical protein